MRERLNSIRLEAEKAQGSKTSADLENLRLQYLAEG